MTPTVRGWSCSLGKAKKKVREAIKNDAFVVVNRVTFEYFQCLRWLVTSPYTDPKPPEYVDISSQLLLRTYYDKDVNEKRMSIISGIEVFKGES